MQSLKTPGFNLLPYAGLFTLAMFAEGCHGSSHSVPVLHELESNDAPADANHFGLLRRGDRLVIEGVIGDPFFDIDGFAFTSASPIHVDFQLFAGNDLDVCLYDPAIDTTVACFATANHPERGGVDVFDGGLEFHLTIEACIEPGCFPQFGTPYTLELDVQPLFASTHTPNADAGLSMGPLPLRGILGVGAARDASRSQDPAAAARYKQRAAPEELEELPELILEEHTQILFDEETQSIFALRFKRVIDPRNGK